MLSNFTIDSQQVNDDIEHSSTISSRRKSNSIIKQVYLKMLDILTCRVDVLQTIYLILHVGT